MAADGASTAVVSACMSQPISVSIVARSKSAVR